MRCDEVIRELAAPTGDRDRAAIADHLAGCPACAEWARRAEGVDRLWEATRPAEPSAAAWDAVWANVARALPPASAPASRNGTATKVHVDPGPVRVPAARPPRGPSWRFAAVAAIGLAQAAAILVALGLAWRAEPPVAGTRRVPAPPVLVQQSAPTAVRAEKSVDVTADVEAGYLMVIRVDQKSGRVEDRTPPEMNVSADVGMVITNEMEWIATPRVAAQ